jgi:formylglycine-generating enzyme required for sulfatase activity
MMGSEEADDDARPVHRVRVSPFWLSRFEVTREQYARFMTETGRKAPALWTNPRLGKDPSQPVIGVNWEDARAFCVWCGGRLPTEAEWEFAARGPRGHRFPWGDEDPTPARAVFHRDIGFGGTMAVGSAPSGANRAGVLDLAGNVFEWCADWYDPAYYTRARPEDPSGPEKGTLRVVRGGSWISLPDAIHGAARAKFAPDSRSTLLGIRVARSEGPPANAQ